MQGITERPYRLCRSTISAGEGATVIEDLKVALARATENNQLTDELLQQQLESEVVKTALEKVRTLEQEESLNWS